MAMWRITVSASGMYLGEKLSNFMNRGRLTEEAASIFQAAYCWFCAMARSCASIIFLTI